MLRCGGKWFTAVSYCREDEHTVCSVKSRASMPHLLPTRRYSTARCLVALVLTLSVWVFLDSALLKVTQLKLSVWFNGVLLYLTLDWLGLCTSKKFGIQCFVYIYIHIILFSKNFKYLKCFVRVFSGVTSVLLFLVSVQNTKLSEYSHNWISGMDFWYNFSYKIWFSLFILLFVYINQVFKWMLILCILQNLPAMC